MTPAQEKRRALLLSRYRSDEALRMLEQELPAFATMGIDTLILEVDYAFAFESHPELRDGEHPISKTAARRFARCCREHGIQMLPLFQCLGHQSAHKKTGPLLRHYPQYDLTPGAFPGNKGIYSREWNPLEEGVNRLVFDLMDELTDAFEADSMHIGMDEVFLLGHPLSPTCGMDPAELFARAVNDIHAHLVGKNGLTLWMWGDRLLDTSRTGYDTLESSDYGTAPAIDVIPKDIIICDWHNEPRTNYPSIPLFLEQGFRIFTAGSTQAHAVKQLIESGYAISSPLVCGHLFTTWAVPREQLGSFKPLVEGLQRMIDLEQRA